MRVAGIMPHSLALVMNYHMFTLRTRLRNLITKNPYRNVRSIGHSVSLTPRTFEVFVPELEVTFPYRWLRDSCQCSACVHPSNLQKLHRTSDIPTDMIPAEMALVDRDLHITWPRNVSYPQHKSVYSLEWLKNYASAENRRNFHRDVDKVTWNSSQLANAPHLFINYEQLGGDTEMLIHAATQLTKYGIVFIKGVPNDMTDDQQCELRQLAGKFGRIRGTFYGDVWNVKNVRNSTNIAYTNLDLGLHMDLQ